MNPDYNALVRFVQAWSAQAGIPVDRVALSRPGGKRISLYIPPAGPQAAAIPDTPATANPAGEPDPSPPDERGERVHQCARDILLTLEDVGHPMTTLVLIAEMEKRGRAWGDRTVQRQLAKLVADGGVVSGEGKKPPGYRMAHWETDPTPE